MKYAGAAVLFWLFVDLLAAPALIRAGRRARRRWFR